MSRYIDADALFSIFKALKWDASCSIVNGMLTADVVKVKHGKNISDSGFLCNVCSFGDFGGFHGYEPNYCPNCGTKMDERRNDDKGRSD